MPGRDSLGRFNHDIRPEKRKNYIGMVSGKLTVIDVEYMIPYGRSGRKRTICTCKCECGNICRTQAENISSKIKLSCGCDSIQRMSEKHRKDLTGQRFGKLVVLEMIWQNWKDGGTHCKCKCDCGNECIVKAAQLPYGKTKSCGCLCGSYNEALINDILKESNVKYIREYRFLDCYDKYTLPFDFAIFNDDNSIKCIIEYDGKQHYESCDYFGGEQKFERQKYHDSIKDEYCKENGICLIRLPYTMSSDEIEKKVRSIVNP